MVFAGIGSWTLVAKDIALILILFLVPKKSIWNGTERKSTSDANIEILN